MNTITKQWNYGDTLTIEYSGEGNGEATFSSDTNEGEDREMQILIESASGIRHTRVVRQEGKREPLQGSDGVFCGKDGERFLCLKAEFIQNK